MSKKYYIEIHGRDWFSPYAKRNSDVQYSITVGQVLPTKTCKPEHGLCSAGNGVETREEAIAFARGVLEQYREHPDDRSEGRPAPTPQNTELRDDTGEFAMSEFFDRGTLDAYMDDAE